MKYLLSVSILWIWMQTGYAQEAPGILEGLVLQGKTNEALEGVNVILVGTNRGDATDKNGYFKIDNIQPGQHEVAVQLIGYKTVRKGIRIISSETLKLNLTLEPEILEGTEVTVEGVRVDDIRLEITPPSFELKSQEILQMAGAQEDVMRSILSLPGVQATSDFSNQFIVRGGGPDQNLILLDDVEIYNPYRNTGMPSLINPNVIKDVNLYASGYPALFGDRLSSVLTVHSRDGSTQDWLKGSLGANLTSANLLLEGKMPFWGGSWFLSNRRSYNQLFAKSWSERLTPNEVAFPDFEDWHVKAVLNPAPAHRLRFNVLLGRNNQDFLVKEELGEQDSDRENLDGEDRVETNILGGSWDYFPSTNIQTRLHANWYRNKGQSNFAGDFVPGIDKARANLAEAMDLDSLSVFAQGDSTFLIEHSQRFDFQKFSFGGWLVFDHDKHVIESGFGVDFLQNSLTSELQLSSFGEVVFDALQTAPNFLGALVDSADQSSSYERAYFYLQDRWSVMGGRVAIQPGLRIDYYDLINRVYASPRLRISYELDPITTVTASWGLYRQSPGFEKLLDGGRVFDLLRFEDLAGLSAERAMHTGFGVQRWFGDQWHFTLEAYHKKFDDLIDQTIELVERPVAIYLSGDPADSESYVVQDGVAFRRSPVPVNDVTGTALGVDLRFEKRVNDPSDHWSGWLSYSLGKSTRKQTFGDVRLSYPFDFDRRHSLDLVLNFRLSSKVNAGFTWRYGTGFPYTPALAVEPLVAEIQETPGITPIPTILKDPETGAVRFVPTFGGPENINSLRYPDYDRLDARITYSTRLLNSDWQFYADFINIFDRKNVLFYRSIIQTNVDETLPEALRFTQVRAFEEPVYIIRLFRRLG